MRVIVTGGSGFVGRHLVKHLAESGDEVLCADLSPKLAEGDPLSSYCQYVRLDIADYDACSKVISRFKPDVIYHLAGIAFVPEAENDFNSALIVNVGGSNNLARSCHLLHLGTTIVYISSAEVYGKISPDSLPLDENTAINPANNYSLSKAMGEMVMKRYAQFGYVRSLIMRPFNHIGPGQNDRFVVPSFAKQLAQIKTGKAEPVIRVGNLEAQRDFCDVRDVVRAYRLAAQKGSGIYNLCSGNAVSIKSMLDMLIEISGLKVTIEQDASRMRPSDMPIFYGSYQKAQAELDWQPQHSLQQSLEEVYSSIMRLQ